MVNFTFKYTAFREKKALTRKVPIFRKIYVMKKRPCFLLSCFEFSNPIMILQDSFQRRKKVNGDRKYRVIQCTGYLKSWSSSTSNVTGTSNPTSGEDEVHDNHFSETELVKSMEVHGAMDCLVAVGRVQSSIGN